MGRPRRAQPTTVPLHITARGVRRLPIFATDEDYELYTSLLAEAARRFGWTILSFSLLPNHVHLVIRLRKENLAEGMKWLHCLHATRFNRRHGYSGHAFDSRYYSKPIESEEHLLRVMRYVALNPVLAGLCDDPGDWRWSSFAGIAAEGRGYSFVAEARARAIYAADQSEGAHAFAASIRSALGELTAA